jgi:hypothetical protein
MRNSEWLKHDSLKDVPETDESAARRGLTRFRLNVGFSQNRRMLCMRWY